MANDYIPQTDGAFLEWTKTLVSYVSPKLASFNIPEGSVSPIQAQLAAYEAAFATAQDPNRGKVDIYNKNDTRDTLKSSIRVFVRAYLAHNPAVSDADKERMGLPLYDKSRSSVPAPATIPELELDSSIIRHISVHFRDAGSEKRGKPAHVHGIELRWAVRDNPPSSVEDLAKSAYDTASPYTFKFDEPERGKTLYICPRWENNKGDAGPWGEIVKAIIP